MQEKEASLKRKDSKYQKSNKRFVPFYIMMLPGILYLLINNYIPMAGIIIAFKRMNFRLGVWKSPWVGVDNFKFLFQSSDAYITTRNTILYNVEFIVFGTLMAVGVAILLDEFRGKFTKKISQTIILIPYLVSMVVVSYLVNALLSTDNGFINNSILEPMGIKAVSWYTAKRVWPFIIIIVYLWKDFGY
jgi:putative aldouronate transport system permease protein